jgi:hypothetical protein
MSAFRMHLNQPKDLQKERWQAGAVIWRGPEQSAAGRHMMQVGGSLNSRHMLRNDVVTGPARNV